MQAAYKLWRWVARAGCMELRLPLRATGFLRSKVERSRISNAKPRDTVVITVVVTYLLRTIVAPPGFARRSPKYTRCDMVALKVRKVGNSLGLVLPKEVVNRLRTSEGEEVFLIEGPNNTYRLTPFDPAFQKKMEKAEEIMSRYRNTLNVLSK
jgi:putative addiction module antidote